MPMSFLMVDRYIKKLVGILCILVKVEKFILPTDFVVSDCDIDIEVPIILG